MRVVYDGKGGGREGSNPCLAACRTQYGYTLPYSRVIEVEPRRTPVGVYTLVECSSDLMRRATISRSRSRNWIHRDSSSISHLTVPAESSSTISDYRVHSLHREVSSSIKPRTDSIDYKCTYWIILFIAFLIADILLAL